MDWLSQLVQLRDQGTPHALVTVTHTTGSTPRDHGAKMIVTREGLFHGTIGGGKLEQLAIIDAIAALESGQSRFVRYPLCERSGQCCGGVTEMWMDVLGTGPSLYIFGAGHVGQAVARVADGTPFRVHVWDEREEWITSSALPSGVVRHRNPWRELMEQMKWENAYAVVMTHSHDLDRELIGDLVKRPAKYIGLIGSKSKWSRFQLRLSQSGITEEELERVECPIGVPLGGGKAPQEIGISFAARILKIHYAEQEHTRVPTHSFGRGRELADANA